MSKTRPLIDFKGDKLIIGCGNSYDHFFNLTDEKGTPSETLHPSAEFYTVNDDSLIQDIDADLVMDFTDPEILKHFGNRKFSFICFERILNLFADKETITQCMKHAAKLLTPNGVCIIYAGGRYLTPTLQKHLTSFFSYNHLIKYGEGEAWTLIAANQEKALSALFTESSNSYFATIYKAMQGAENYSITKFQPLLSTLPAFFSKRTNTTISSDAELLPIQSNIYYLMDDNGNLPVAGYNLQRKNR